MKPTNMKRYSEYDDETPAKDETIVITVRVPKRLQDRIKRFIKQEHEGAPRLQNWFVNKWISEGLKREGEGY